MSSYRVRKVTNHAWTAICAAAVVVALLPLLSLLWLVVSRGASGLSLAFFVERPTPVGEPGGGVGNAILGTLLMVPPLARAAEEFVRLVPGTLREASLALGVAQWRTSLRVVLRTALPGILTAILLAVARAAGETAPLLFTALNNQYWNTRPDQPTASLTVQIFNYAISPYDDWHQKAWSAALVLLLLVGVLNLFARAMARGRLGGAT